MTVVFEILSPGNDPLEMADKLAFYDDYGAEEYYLYDPDGNRLHGYGRRGQTLARVRPMNGFVSPRLGVRFDLSGPELVVYWPDGRPFLTFEELEAERVQAEQRAEQAVQRLEQAEQRMEQAVQRLEQTEQRMEQAVQRAGVAEQRAEQAERRAHQVEQQAARLAELSRKALHREATPEEVAELERLLPQAPPGD
jgi:Uma2 family endonuclease